jgi:Flp pilus assembly pilin Flp
MQHCLRKVWRQEDGVLSFEWVLLTTLVVVGIVGGLAAARDAVIDELGDVAQGMLALDGSYSISYPLQLAIARDAQSASVVVGGASDSSFIDALRFSDCDRTNFKGQGP